MKWIARKQVKVDRGAWPYGASGYCSDGSRIDLPVVVGGGWSLQENS